MISAFSQFLLVQSPFFVGDPIGFSHQAPVLKKLDVSVAAQSSISVLLDLNHEKAGELTSNPWGHREHVGLDLKMLG